MTSTWTCDVSTPALPEFSTWEADSGRAAGSWVPAAGPPGPGRPLPGSSAGSLVPDPRIENRIANISHQVADNGDHSDQHGDPEHDLVIVAEGRLVVLEPSPRPVEHLLDDQGPGQDQRDREADQSDDRDE